jgi:hypothetical protein
MYKCLKKIINNSGHNVKFFHSSHVSVRKKVYIPKKKEKIRIILNNQIYSLF